MVLVGKYSDVCLEESLAPNIKMSLPTTKESQIALSLVREVLATHTRAWSHVLEFDNTAVVMEKSVTAFHGSIQRLIQYP